LSNISNTDGNMNITTIMLMIAPLDISVHS